MSNWRFLIGITVGAVVITSVPYLFGLAIQPKGTVYSGRHGLAPGDISNYYQMIEQARGGAVLFTDPFTSEPQQPAIFNPYWLLVGQVARLTGWSNAFVFQLARITAIPLLLAALYWLLRELFAEEKTRRYVLIFCLGASGIGAWSLLWLHYFIDTHANNIMNQPIDLWVSEAVTFLTLFQTGHFIVATALIIVIFLLMYRGLSRHSWQPIWWASAAGLFLFFFHPFHVPTVFGVLGVYTVAMMIVRRRILWGWVGRVGTFAALTMPAWLYQILFVWLDPIAAGRASQNLNPTPALWNVLLGYGFLLPAAIGGIWWLVKSKKLRGPFVFLLVWLVVQTGLIYAPLDWQRRLTHGLQIPLTIFAALGVWALYQRLRRQPRRYLVGGTIAVASILFTVSNLYVFASDFATMANLRYQKPIYSLFYPQSLAEAFRWVKTSVNPGETILAHTITGNLLVGQTARTVYVGHSVETLHALEKNDATKHFFDPATSMTERQVFLAAQHIRYVLYGPIERYYSWYEPDFLPVVFTNGDVTIYGVPQ